MLIQSKHSPSAFIIPCYVTNAYELLYLKESVEGLMKQSDPNWKAIIIDDASSYSEVKLYLQELSLIYPTQIDVRFLESNVGPGICRNIGIQWASNNNCDIVLFNDADDISHPDRLTAVRNCFLEAPHADVAYSSFIVIDEGQRTVPKQSISTPILEILESYGPPLEGREVWIEMGTQTGYINNTSSTAVRTSLIKKCPFPNERASEDFHTWMRLSARGAEYRFIPEIPTLYRVPSYMEYQSSRMRIGPSAFNSIKARVDSQGFSLACELALARGVLSMERIPSLKAKFYRRLAQTMTRENEEELSNMLMYLAHQHECEDRLYNNN